MFISMEALLGIAAVYVQAFLHDIRRIDGMDSPST